MTAEHYSDIRGGTREYADSLNSSTHRFTADGNSGRYPSSPEGAGIRAWTSSRRSNDDCNRICGNHGSCPRRLRRRGRHSAIRRGASREPIEQPVLRRTRRRHRIPLLSWPVSPPEDRRISDVNLCSNTSFPLLFLAEVPLTEKREVQGFHRLRLPK